MANPEKNPGVLRRVEPTAEKVGGGLIAVLGLLSADAPAVVAGVLIYLLGRARTPKMQSA